MDQPDIELPTPPALIPKRHGPPIFSSPAGSLTEEVSPRRLTRQMREVFRDAFDQLGGADWLVAFASANDQNARVFVQAISKLIPPSAADDKNKPVVIDVPWLTSARLSYKRPGSEEPQVTDVEVRGG